MTNPLRGWYSDLFGSRGTDVASALNYVDQLATASSDAVAVQTAARVLLNTAINAMDQILNSRSPEKLALIELIDERIKASSSDIDQQISDWIDSNLDVDDKISNWMSDNFDVTDYNVNDAISDWMSNNMTDEIESVIKNSLTFTVIVN
jgi:gas vesicle protein